MNSKNIYSSSPEDIMSIFSLDGGKFNNMVNSRTHSGNLVCTIWLTWSIDTVKCIFALPGYFPFYTLSLPTQEVRVFKQNFTFLSFDQTLTKQKVLIPKSTCGINFTPNSLIILSQLSMRLASSWNDWAVAMSKWEKIYLLSLMNSIHAHNFFRQVSQCHKVISIIKTVTFLRTMAPPHNIWGD